MDEILRLTTPQVATFAARGFLRLDAVVPDEINQAFLADVGDVPEDQVDHILAHYGRIMASSAVPLTLCPLSNLKLQVINDLTEHPVRAFLDAGVIATVNSDDPAYFGGYLNENFQAVASALDLRKDELVTLARNSYQAAFMTEAQRARAFRHFDAVVAAL